MSDRQIKNYGHSVRAKLLNISIEQKIPFQKLLPRYFQERLLYRLSISPYKDNFVLKGGALLYAHEKWGARPTVDIDFLGQNISRNIENIKAVFAEMAKIDFHEDGVVFDPLTMTADEITLDKEYNGVRLGITAHLDTIKQPVSMDIGFGDIITPSPESLDYPTLIPEMTDVNVLAYSLETVVAEKFEAMIALSTGNSRMKDFFDVYRILSSGNVRRDVLEDAIKATLSNRGTILYPDHALFSEDFFADETRVSFWNGFLKKIKWNESIDFKKVGNMIRTELMLYYKEMIDM